jgi:Ca-activated chloride channel family protein
MEDRLAEAQGAAIGFVRAVVRPGDRAFAVAFAGEPKIVQPPTEDVDSLADLLALQRAYGNTALHDALLTSLYYFRGFAGQKALVVLSDGDDTSSSTPWRQALEYARRSGVAIYPVGLGVSGFSFAVRQKLDALATETGGRAFYIDAAAELAAVYAEIEQELRTRYLIAYVSDQTERGDELRQVRVEVRGRGLEARTMRGYYP